MLEHESAANNHTHRILNCATKKEKNREQKTIIENIKSVKKKLNLKYLTRLVEAWAGAKSFFKDN